MSGVKNKEKEEAQTPLILRCHRLMEAFAKSDEERDFYINRTEGFLVYVDLDKPPEQLEKLQNELEKHSEKYCMIPKLSFYEAKKIMEGFVNEKVYDIDTKEKLMDIIQSKEARENFLEFIYDHHSELEKWQQYYQERSRIRIIEWLRQNQFHFVFEEDLDLPIPLLDKLKQSLFDPKVDRDIFAARKELVAKSKTYYSNEALNPRPKRGRPPKQAVKLDVTLQSTRDVYLNLPSEISPFLFTPDSSGGSASIFSSKFGTDHDFTAQRRSHLQMSENEQQLAAIQEKLLVLRNMSKKWAASQKEKMVTEIVDAEPPLIFDPLQNKKEIKKPEKEKQKKRTSKQAKLTAEKVAKKLPKKK